MNMHRNEQENWLYRYRPHYPRFEQIPHYYGDVVRMLLIAASLIIAVGAPFYADMLPEQLPYLIVGVIVAVALAAFTSPWSPLVMRLDAVVSGVGAVIFEYWALSYYQTGSPIEFVLRQAVALISGLAFYFALKTLRSMLTGKLGREADLSEFDSNLEKEAENEMVAFDEPAPEDGLGHPRS